MHLSIYAYVSQRTFDRLLFAICVASILLLVCYFMMMFWVQVKHCVCLWFAAETRAQVPCTLTNQYCCKPPSFQHIWNNVLALPQLDFQGFPTRMVSLYYISCLMHTILVGNPQFLCESVLLKLNWSPLGCIVWKQTFPLELCKHEQSSWVSHLVKRLWDAWKEKNNNTGLPRLTSCSYLPPLPWLAMHFGMTVKRTLVLFTWCTFSLSFTAHCTSLELISVHMNYNRSLSDSLQWCHAIRVFFFFCVRCHGCFDQILSPVSAAYLDVRNKSSADP